MSKKANEEIGINKDGAVAVKVDLEIPAVDDNKGQKKLGHRTARHNLSFHGSSRPRKGNEAIMYSP